MQETGPRLGPDSVIGIVNRGEPALRFIRAVREYNALHGTSLKTASFFLDEEADALFVREADIAIPFHGIPGSSQTGAVYLQHPVLIGALKRAGCDAVWPGWGFVSEDADFVKLVESAGLVFLGPSSSAMALLGDKIAAKQVAEDARVPILPWSRRSVTDIDDARAIAEQIGYPVIVKAALAGGGRGIRFVLRPEDLEAQYASARDETVRITGDDVVFIERLVTRGRHLEVQCLCDRHGNVMTFGVRDCSVQRRNQKIIEETPPPGLAEETLAEIQGAASRLMSAAGYESAGTVEFLYDLDRKEFYFMEVNTRLQVEHPITEVLYGTDLVKQQIRVGFGEVAETAGPPRGWVMEARLNAEDPDREFAPAPGVVERFRVPLGPGVRIDSGIGQGSIIPQSFDSMVAKIIAHGRTRDEARSRLERALRETRVAITGGTTNKAFLLELLTQPEIRSGAVHTKFVEEMLDLGRRESRRQSAVALIAGAIDSHGRHAVAELGAFQQQIANYGYPRRGAIASDHEVTFGAEGNTYEFQVKQVSPVVYQLTVNGRTVTASYVHIDDDFRLELGGHRYSIQTVQRGDVLQCEVDGVPYVLQLESGGAVKAPSPAVVLLAHVREGERVQKGQRLLSLEAMKMEMVVEAPSAGIVKAVSVKPGQQVTTGDILVQLDSADDNQDEPAGGAGEMVDFPADSANPDDVWDRDAEALGAVFFGYDHPANELALFEKLVQSAAAHESSNRLFDLIYRLLEATVRIDSLFSSDAVQAELFARSVSWQELIFIYYQYSMAGSETLPRQFTDALKGALRYYPSAARPDGAWTGFHHMYRAQRRRKVKDALIRAMLFTLERLPVPPSRAESLSRILKHLVHLSRNEGWAISDAALHARYELVDRAIAMNLRNRRREDFQGSLRDYLDPATGSEARDRIRESIVDTSGYADFELLSAYLKADRHYRAGIVDLAARRMARDRTVETCRVVEREDDPFCVVSASDVTTIVALGRFPEIARGDWLQTLLAEVPAGSDPPEVLVLISGSEDMDTIVAAIMKSKADVLWLSVGLYRDAGAFAYRTFVPHEDGWREDTRKRDFSPLFYRELRVERLGLFETELVYYSDTVYLVLATARANPKDRRLLAFGSASESAPVIDENGKISRVDEFDEVFLEAVHKMRSRQSRADRRFLWNRIVIHVRALTPTTAEQIKDYGNRIIPQTTDLGLEVAIIYTRRKRWSESVIRNLELLFLNISEDQFTLRSRKPSSDPLKPMDRYVSNVVRNRQRAVVYPYELIKLITYTGYPVSVNVPRGDFEEYDVSIDADGRTNLLSVKGRPYGENESNVVIGVVKNLDPETDLTYKRVLVLSDATRDLGSLAEAECRRVIAALDLAEKLDVPLEWVPISSGARIDMESGTENLDWTAAVLKRIIEFTQRGGEINVIVSGINVGAQSYWNAEATMLMHTCGLLIMTDEASMLLTGKKALDFSGSVSGDTNTEIGGAEKIMGPNGQAQIRVSTLSEAYTVLFSHYRYTYRTAGATYPMRVRTKDSARRDVGKTPYEDRLGQGFARIADIFGRSTNPDRKKPFDMRQVMGAVIDNDAGHLERWGHMLDGETAITWETRIGGYGTGLIGIESRPLVRIGDVPFDGPQSWSGGTLFPSSSKKVARAINAWSGRLPVVVLANLSGFDGSPESLRRLQLEYGAEIGRAVVNFSGPMVFVVVARYHGGAYVVFSRMLNPNLTVYALEGSFASVLGGAPAAAVVFPRQVEKQVQDDSRIVEAGKRLASDPVFTDGDYDEVYRTVYAEKQTELGNRFDSIHDIARAKSVGSIHDVITVKQLRSTIVAAIEAGLSSV